MSFLKMPIAKKKTYKYKKGKECKKKTVIKSRKTKR